MPYVPFIDRDTGSESGSEWSQAQATVDPLTVARVTFDHESGTNGLFARGVMGAMTNDGAMGAVARAVWNNTFGLTTGAQAPSLGRLMEPDEANQLYSSGKLKFDRPIYEATARYLNTLHKDDETYARMMSFDPHTWTGAGLKLGAGFASGFTDPAQLAIQFLPPMRLAGLAEGAGLRAIFPTAEQFIGRSLVERAGMRFGQAFTSGAVGGAATGAADWALSSHEQRDYTMADFLSSMVQGGLMYGSLHTLHGGVADLFDKAENFRPQGFERFKKTTPVEINAAPESVAIPISPDAPVDHGVNQEIADNMARRYSESDLQTVAAGLTDSNIQASVHSISQMAKDVGTSEVFSTADKVSMIERVNAFIKEVNDFTGYQAHPLLDPARIIHDDKKAPSRGRYSAEEFYAELHPAVDVVSDALSAYRNLKQLKAERVGKTGPETAPRFLDSTRFLKPGDVAEVSANGGNMVRALSLNDHVIAEELRQGRPLSETERLKILEERNGSRLPDEMGDTVAREKARRTDSYRKQDEQAGAVERAQTESVVNDVPAEAKALAEAVTPEQQLSALEAETNAGEKALQEFEATRPQRIAQAVRAQTAAWKDVKAVVHGTQRDLERALPDEAKLTAEVEASGKKRTVNALYDPSTGTVHVVAENVKTPFELADALRHEGTHVGFERLFGPDDKALYQKISKDIYESLKREGRGDELAAIADAYRFDTTKDVTALVEEFMARESKNAPENSLLDNFLTQLQLMLSKIFPALKKWGIEDMHKLIGLAEQQVTEGRARAGGDAIKYAQQIDPAGGDALKKSGDFGEVKDFAGDTKAAVEWLLQNKTGIADNALRHADVGPISLVYGKDSGKKNSSYGLAKIIKYHPEIKVDQLQELLNGMSVSDKSENTIWLNDDTRTAVIRRNIHGEPKEWVLTAYEKKKAASAAQTMDRGGNEGQSGQALSDRSGTDNISPDEGKNQAPKHSQEVEGGDNTVEPSIQEQLSTLNQAVNNAVTRDEKFAALQSKRATILNHLVESNINDYLSRFKDPYQGLDAYLAGTNQSRISGARNGVAQRQYAIEKEYQAALFVKLTKENLWREYSSKACERDILRELWRMGQPEELKDALPRGGDPRFERVAQIVDDVRKGAVARANRAGAYIANLPGYLFRQTHDMGAVKSAGFEAWRDFISDKLDWRQIETQLNLEGEKGFNRDAFLRGAYDGIVTGVHLHDASPMRPSGYQMPANQARRMSASRKLHFASADGFADYNDKFGTRSMSDGIAVGLNHLAHSTALLEAFGPNPEMMFDKVMSQLRVSERFNKPDGIVSSVKRYGSLNMEGWLQQLFGTIAGLDRIPGNVNVARIGSAVRSIENMTRLGGVALSSLPDAGTAMMELHYQGIPAMQAMNEILLGAVHNTVDGDAKLVAASLGAGIDGMLGDILHRVDAPNAHLGHKLNAAQNFFFKATGLEWWTDVNKRSVARAMSAWLGVNSDKAFGALKPETQRMLSMFELGEGHWDVMRALSESQADGRKYILPQHVQRIADSTLKTLKESEGFSKSLEAYRDELQTRWMNYFTDRTDYGVLTPGARERSMLMMGTKPGTFLGEAIRCMAQFKSFGLAHMTKLMAREVYGREGGVERMAGLSALVAMTTALGYGAMQMQALASGKTPYQPGWKTFQAALAKGGGFGIMTDYLFGQYDPNRSFAADMAGPVVGDINAINNLRAKLMDGGDVTAADVRTFRGMVPFNNLIGLKTAIDYGAMYQLQEWMNPGYLDRMERNLKNNTGQEFLVPPSSFVR